MLSQQSLVVSSKSVFRYSDVRVQNKRQFVVDITLVTVLKHRGVHRF